MPIEQSVPEIVVTAFQVWLYLRKSTLTREELKQAAQNLLNAADDAELDEELWQQAYRQASKKIGDEIVDRGSVAVFVNSNASHYLTPAICSPTQTCSCRDWQDRRNGGLPSTV